MDEVLLKVWREVGLHDGIDAVVSAVADLLKISVPVTNLEILRFDSHRTALRTVATGSGRDADIALSGDRFGSLLDWFERERTTAATAAGPWPAPLAPLEEIYAAHDVLLGTLSRDRDGRPRTIAVLLAPAGSLEEPGAQRRLAQLLEPLSAAVAQHERREELGALRAAARNRQTADAIARERPADGIVGSDSGLRPVMIRLDQVAPSDSSVLLLGETGSGKEVIARAIHERSLRADAPFIRVNCGALPPELIDSELFGHEKGSFTGAAARRKGWFEQADGGTLFLDEVGELPPAVQVRLLRVLQDGSLTRVGGEEAIHVDVRVIAATHRDLAAMVQEGTFREDLWYRIAVFPILIPPLRERRQDIPELARHFARRASAKIGLHPQMPTDADLSLLQDYAWPGNVREMASVIERAAILGEGQRLDVAAALGLSVPARSAGGRPHTADTSQRFSTLEQVIVDHIHAALRLTRGRVEGRKGAARLLGVNPHTLRSRMRKLGIDAAPYRREAEDDD